MNLLMAAGLWDPPPPSGRQSPAVGEMPRSIPAYEPLSDRPFWRAPGRKVPATEENDAKFTPDSFRFLRELAQHNNREWFTANKARYEQTVRDPSFAFVRAIGYSPGEIEPPFGGGSPTRRGSIMRIYRDIRFSKDKSPYRTSIGIHFSHEGTGGEEEHLPGFFLRLAPGDSWLYSGVWQPEPARLHQIRKALIERSADGSGSGPPFHPSRANPSSDRRPASTPPIPSSRISSARDSRPGAPSRTPR